MVRHKTNKRTHLMRIGLYPGTFDPITYGHIDIIRRACSLVDRLVIGVAINRDKGPLFDLEERVAMIDAEYAKISEDCGVEIVAHPFENLLIHCAEDVGASVIVRGLRAVSDFEYEFQLATMNRHLEAEVETVFMTPTEKYTFVSSTLVREIAKMGGDVSGFVAPAVATALQRQFGG